MEPKVARITQNPFDLFIFDLLGAETSQNVQVVRAVDESIRDIENSFFGIPNLFEDCPLILQKELCFP